MLTITIELLCLKHRWLEYNGCFELFRTRSWVPNKKNPIAADIIVFWIIWDGFLFYIDNGILCVCHRGGKNRGPTRTRTQGLSLSVRRLSYWANGRSLIFSPCLNKFVPESARNNGGTTRHAHYDAGCPSREPTLNHQMSQGRKKSWPDRDSNPGPLAIRETTLPTELPSHRVVL